MKTTATIYLLAYTGLLAAGHLLKKRILTAHLLVALTALELAHFDHITVSERETVSKGELKSNVGYNDETIDAVRDLRAVESDFFRLTKLRPSAPTIYVGLNDAMVFGYYGTSSYSSFNDVHYTNFLTAAGAILPYREIQTRWAPGLLDDPLMATFACEKYALVDVPDLYQRILAYRFVKRYGADYLFYNDLFLPLGLTFTRYLTRDAFVQLPAEEKAEALIRVVVVANDSDGAERGLARVSPTELENEMKTVPLPYVVVAHRDAALRMTSFSQSRIEGTLVLDQKTVLVFQTPFERGWLALVDGKATPVLEVDSGLLGVALGPGEQKVELRYRNPLLLPGAGISLSALLLLICALWRWPRLKMEH